MNFFYVLVPLISGLLTTFFFPVGPNSGINVKFRPPAFIFGIVWPILYIFMGLAWNLSLDETNYYWVLNTFLCLWSIVYSKNKTAATWVLLSCLIVNLCTILVSSNIHAKLLLSPLFGWLIFALLMNTTEVQYLN